ncbi:hypothetical protein DUNSADRAFT_2353 [Dunaliella salina]|uniref:Ribosome biogenesis protein SLX9 n=1 Tax=Dunaliella salina TaxID=3046 RepID=A0ABQ7GVU2_DUNSA|nr:hypothetical protein DUNSADRAFT_2353 [Dunaliella salina]|eukprot:KAF5838728.1 hypothetical protein DUNSADRAFT_2353 [Dunaliella salina]
MGKQKQATKPPAGVKKQQQLKSRKDLQHAKSHSKAAQQRNRQRNPHAAFSGLGESNLASLLDETAEELSQRHNIRGNKRSKPKHQPAVPQQVSQAAMDEEGPQVPCLAHPQGEGEQPAAAAADGSRQLQQHQKQLPVMQEIHPVPQLSHQGILRTLSSFDLK